MVWRRTAAPCRSARLLDFLRLHAAADPPGRDDEAPRDLCFSHDSIALGQDGSTDQPVEQLAGLRAVPGLTVIRSGDANETAVAWRVALEARDHPIALVLTRQNVPTLDRARCAAADGLRQGAYVLADAANGRPDVILIATGSEVGLIMAARQTLQERNVMTRVVSMPSWELFDAQPRSYRDQVFLPAVHARLAVEAGASQGWHRYVGDRGDVLGVARLWRIGSGRRRDARIWLYC